MQLGHGLRPLGCCPRPPPPRASDTQASAGDLRGAEGRPAGPSPDRTSRPPCWLASTSSMAPETPCHLEAALGMVLCPRAWRVHPAPEAGGLGTAPAPSLWPAQTSPSLPKTRETLQPGFRSAPHAGGPGGPGALVASGRLGAEWKQRPAGLAGGEAGLVHGSPQASGPPLQRAEPGARGQGRALRGWAPLPAGGEGLTSSCFSFSALTKSPLKSSFPS